MVYYAARAIRPPEKFLPHLICVIFKALYDGQFWLRDRGRHQHSHVWLSPRHLRPGHLKCPHWTPTLPRCSPQPPGTL